MAIINCPECGGKVSDKADVCPHCGYAIGKENAETILSVRYGDKAALLAVHIPISIYDGATNKKLMTLRPEEVVTIKLDISEPMSIYANMPVNPKSPCVNVEPHKKNMYEITAHGLIGSLKLIPVDFMVSI